MSAVGQKGFDVVGIEPGKQARLHAQRHHGLKVLAELDQAPHGFPGTILWHVLEHVEDPVAFLTKIRSRLTSEGLLVVAAPNAASEIFHSSGLRWTLPVRLTRAVWRPVTILITVKRFGPDQASTLLVVARPAPRQPALARPARPRPPVHPRNASRPRRIPVVCRSPSSMNCSGLWL